jgi:hypothetical protein
MHANVLLRHTLSTPAVQLVTATVSALRVQMNVLMAERYASEALLHECGARLITLKGWKRTASDSPRCSLHLSYLLNPAMLTTRVLVLVLVLVLILVLVLEVRLCRGRKQRQQ